MIRRAAAGALVALSVVLALAAHAEPASAHAGLVNSNPAPGATLGAAPTAIELSFSERPDVKLSSATVVDTRGAPHQGGPVQAVPGDPLSFELPVRPVGRGIYTVHWRVDSAIDGHATTGFFQFGVLVSPSQVQSGASSSTKPVSSPLELGSRWVLLLGLVALLGGATAAVAGFGGPGTAPLRLAAGGWGLAAVGLVALGAAQRSNAHASLGTLLSSPIGHALIWRAVGIAAAGAALLLAARAGRGTRARRIALGGAGVAALATIVVHVANGHAAASQWPPGVTVLVQSAHFAVAGIWIGGLAALLIGLRGAPSMDKAAAVRRFSMIAAAGFGVIVVTGIARAFSELRDWDQLLSTGYGRAIVAKLALVAFIGGLAARNHRRSVPVAAVDLAPLRRASRVELSAGVVALGVAALLGTLAPPVAGRAAGLAGLSASGGDVGGTVRVKLTAVSDEPGPNRFIARIEKSGSGGLVRGASVNLLFTPLDDPGVRSSTLPLAPASDGTYVGSGANMKFDGRWGVRVLIARLGRTVEVPLELDPVGPVERVSIVRIPGHAPTYSTLADPLNIIQISPDPERSGPSRLGVSFFTAEFGDEQRISRIVVTLAASHRPIAQQSVVRLGPGRFVSDVRLSGGHDQIAVTARTNEGVRLRSVFDLRIPSG
jgi:copper transport protein